MNKTHNKAVGGSVLAVKLFRALCVLAIAASAYASSGLDMGLMDEADAVAYTEDKSPVGPSMTSTKDELLAVGRQLSGGSASDGRYLAIHGERDDEAGGATRTADVIFVGPDSNVTTTRCLFLIIAGYLQSYPSFTDEGAYEAAQRICWWNSAHYGDTQYFASLFGDAVMDAFADKTQSIGLSKSYQDWPGKTRIVIPWATSGAGESGGAVAVDEALLTGTDDADGAGGKDASAPTEPQIEKAQYVPKGAYDAQSNDTISERLSIPSGFLVLLGMVFLAIIVLLMLLIKVIMDLSRDRG